MDVRCERCKTEYEFDDSRITEAGVTVKCTTCGHVFKVKKKALVFTVPLKEGDAQQPPQAPLPPAAATGTAPAREWKVRQANGNVFTFKELTTLQKWIVERKVSRDDEISLTGESWKRLGNIAELASFFQVVDEAQKAVQLTALQNQLSNPLLTPSSGFQVPVVQNTPAQAWAAPPPPAPAAVAPPPPSPSPNELPTDLGVNRRTGPTSMGAGVNMAARSAARDPNFARVRSADRDDDIEAAAFGRKKGGGAAKVLIVLLVLAALGAGGYYGYFYYWLPMQESEAKAKADADRIAKEKADADAKAKADADAKAKADAEAKARAEAEAKADAGAAAPDAGALAAAGAADAGATAKKPEPARDFDYYVAQGERLRERGQPKAALDAYGKAADLKPESVEPIVGRGWALLDLGMVPQAQASFETALKQSPRFGEAQMGMAEAYRAQGNKAKAIEFYEKYLDAHPEGPEAVAAKNQIDRLKE